MPETQPNHRISERQRSHQSQAADADRSVAEALAAPPGKGRENAKQEVVHMLEEFDAKVVIFNAKVGKPEDQRAGCAPCAAQIAQGEPVQQPDGNKNGIEEKFDANCPEDQRAAIRKSG